MSSTSIGWCLHDGRMPLGAGTCLLKGDALDRLVAAELAMLSLMERCVPNALAMEGAAFSRFEVQAQERAKGVARLVWRRAGNRSVIEVPPTTAKKAMTGAGNADKEIVTRYAQEQISGGDEHAHDALAIALGALAMARW